MSGSWAIATLLSHSGEILQDQLKGAIIAHPVHEYLNVFLKKAVDTLPSHSSTDHHITLKNLEDIKKLGYSSLYSMLQEE